MPTGNPQYGLLKGVIDVLRHEPPGQFVHCMHITEKLKALGQWDDLGARTPERTVCMYLSRNPEIFVSDGEGAYHLRESHRLGS